MGSKPDFDRDLVPAVRLRGRVMLRGPNRGEQLSDAISVAWELAQTAPERADAMDIAYYACLRVRSGRVFRESVRSVTGPQRRRKKPQREQAAIGRLTSKRHGDPAATATLLVDYHAWLPTLTPREQAFLAAFIAGETTGDIAARFGVSAARVSQMRRKLLGYWKAYTAG